MLMTCNPPSALFSASRRPWFYMVRLATLTAISTASALAATAPGAADAGPDGSEFIRDYVRQGVTPAGSRIVNVALPTGKISYAFSIRSFVSFMGSVSRPRADLKDFIDRADQACKSQDADLRFSPGPFQGRDHVVDMWYGQLAREHLVGKFTCTTPQNNKRFFFEIRPASDADSTLPPGFDWNLSIVAAGAMALAQDELEQKALKNRSEEEAAMSAENQIAKYKFAVSWREKLASGMQSHCGLVIERKGEIAKIQTQIGEHWLRVDQIHPPGAKRCRFENGQYVD